MSFRSATFVALLTGAFGVAGIPVASQAATFFNGTYNFTQSEAFGTGLFGNVTVSGTAADTTVSVNVSPNFVIDTGSHFAFTFSLAGSGATLGPITPAAADAELDFVAGSGPFSNSPFGNWTNAIQSNKTNGGAGDLSAFIFHVFNFQGFNTATSLFNGLQILFGADIVKTVGCTGSCTGVIGATVSQVPLPGALVLFGSALVGMGVIRRRRNKGAAHQAA